MECAKTVLKNIAGIACVTVFLGVMVALVVALSVLTAATFGFGEVGAMVAAVIYVVIGLGTFSGLAECWGK